MHDAAQIAELIKHFAAGIGVSVSYASMLLTRSGDTVARIDAGGGLTLHRANKILRCASDRWPADLPWPPDVPRPAPAPNSPGARDMEGSQGLPAVGGDPAAWCAARFEERLALMAGGRADEAERVRLDMLAVATALGPDGRLASPAALLAATGYEAAELRHVIDYYRDGAPGGSPRAEASRELLRLLVASGDARFAARRLPGHGVPAPLPKSGSHAPTGRDAASTPEAA